MVEKKGSAEVAAAEEALHALSFRALASALVIAIVLFYLAAQWIRLGELIASSSEVSEAVPPVPAVVALVFLLAMNPLLRKVSRRLALSRGQILVIYTFTMVAVAMLTNGVTGTFLPAITTLQYFSGSKPEYAPLLKYLDPRFFPKDDNVIQAFYEGADNERVPWDAWMLPTLLWLAFFVIFSFTMLCLLTILRKQWVEKERLSFPLVQFALEMTEQGGQRAKTKTFFRNPLMWIGFGMAALIVGTNILASFDPALPHIGGGLPLPLPEDWGQFTTVVRFRPVWCGLGYLVPLDITFSAWVCYWLVVLEGRLARALGREARISTDAFMATGSYLGLLFSLVWVARSHLVDVFRKAFWGDASVDDSQEAMPYRLAVFGSLAGFIFLAGFATVMGLGPLTAALFFFAMLGSGVVYAKLRAEAGASLLWTYPCNTYKELFVFTVGSRHYSQQSLTLLSVFRFLTRGCFIPTFAYQADGMKMAPSGRIRQRQMGTVLLIAIAVGLGTANWLRLVSYYKYGANVLETLDPSTGGYGVAVATGEYNRLAVMASSPSGPNMEMTVWTGIGFLVTGAFIMLRKWFFRFPLHPMGFALAMTLPPVWGYLFWAWLVKFIVLKLGGLRLYERLTPWALGMVFGEFFTSGIWSFICLANPEWGQRFHIHFAM